MANKTSLKIEGMTCEHCAMKVTKALEEVSGVQSVKVNLKKNQATVKHDENATTALMSEAVNQAGYKVIE
ncbi:MAG: copper ion binding protein [Streptococcaceae bacterium]|nr:copper ion binding protein [Streptococcaceae bacterium]MCL2681674.1 copper ion binding protein [Streptococcaceae bacterium]